MRTRIAVLWFLCIAILNLPSCGGSNSTHTAPPLPADFSIALTPGSLDVQAGGASGSFTISITGQNGFTGAVNVSLSGLPAGTTITPSGAITVSAGQSQSIAVSVPVTTTVGAFAIQAHGSSGTIKHPASLTLNVTAAADFALSVTPASISATIGGSSTAFDVSATSVNDLQGPVAVSVSGLPTGTSTVPSTPFQISPGTTQSVTISVPASAAVGRIHFKVQGTSGVLTHQADVALTVNPQIRTYDTGDMLYLETDTGTETAKIGLLKAWGGSIIEASLNGVDYVNNDDPGRQIQTSLWDGNDTYGGTWGYNPIEAGSSWFQGSPLLDQALTSKTLYTKTQPRQWVPQYSDPDPNLGDAYIEKWISAVPGYNRVFKVHYKITHFGNDSHADAMQELPVMYVNPNVQTFMYYSGDEPWTNGALTPYTMPYSCCPFLHTPEQWGAYVDANDVGIALYTPMQYPDSKGFNAGSTLQFTPLCPYSWDPGSVLEFDTFILLGSVDESRLAIYALHSAQDEDSPLPPLAFLDTLAKNSTVSGTIAVGGWVWSLSPITHIDVLVDDSLVGNAAYGLSRDVTDVFPAAPLDSGYKYLLDTTKFSNGPHTILVKIVDRAGHVATLQTVPVTVQN